MAEKEKDKNIQQDQKDTEKGSQLQSNEMEKAQGNKKETKDEDE
ncbi:hypothetical protein [Oceanobacillus massiliensis]|nr:hypothetical protein [Oceanobacillus massiliensis]